MMYTTYFHLAYIKKSTYMGLEREGQRGSKCGKMLQIGNSFVYFL